MTVSEAIEEVFIQTIKAGTPRLFNPIWGLCHTLTGKCYAFSELERVSDQNSKLIRDTLRTYIRKRVSGEIKSDLANNSDLMSLMLANGEVF